PRLQTLVVLSKALDNDYLGLADYDQTFGNDRDNENREGDHDKEGKWHKATLLYGYFGSCYLYAADLARKKTQDTIKDED
ncbi:MAG: hypothetical protein Q8M66_06240, partial [Actinomycetota bacterium]|nr:hypothetical protein [Actinomycetota bacterium]